MISPEVQVIALTFANGSVGIMRFVTHDPRAGWRREASDENIFREIAKLEQTMAGGPDAHRVPVESYRRITEADIPRDRTFRDALVDIDSAYDMVKARAIQLRRVREARVPKLEQLDREWMKATGQGDTAEVRRIEVARQALRDLPAALDVDTARDVTELKARWSPLLDR